VLAAGPAFALVAVCLEWAAGSPLAVLRGVGGSGNPDFEVRLVDAAGLMAWACLGWFAVVLVVELATTLPGWCGRGCGAVARAISPRVVRRLAQGLIGLSVLAGPFDAGAALAATIPPPPAASSISAAANSAAATDGAYFTTLDRPASGRASPAVHTTRPPPPNHSPAVDLDRPRPRFVPAPPVPVSTVVSPTTANVLTGATRGEGIDAIYVVRRGDALWDVAARHLGPDASHGEIAREWPRWYAANRAVIGGDPDLIRPGEILTPPGP
jgi:nucleoid-associated protein YgaU